MSLKIIKRNGDIVPFDKNKIETAILQAMKYGSGIHKPDIARLIAKNAENHFNYTKTNPTIYQIEDFIYFELLDYDEEVTAKAYIGYKEVQSFKRNLNTTDGSIMGLLRKDNEEVMNENSNKNAVLASTQRDLVAGEVSKDIARRILVKANLVQAHDDGIIHIHDLDYLMQPIFNCCLINIKDMLDYGTVINGKMVDSPKSFQTACTILTQIVAQVASNQYGGQSVNIRHLGRYLRKSYDKHYKNYVRKFTERYTRESDLIDDTMLDHVNETIKSDAEFFAKERMMEELKAGVQTIQYQINTLMTTNGQAPFVTLFLELREDDEYIDEVALIIEEILKQRHEGIKNDQGIYVTPAFPKLVYVLDEHNCLEGGKYDYITKLAAKCTIKRMYPDYISAKKMRETYEGNVFSPMGCRSFLSPWIDPATGEYKFEGRFNMGVVSLNLAQIGILSQEEPESFWNILDERLELCKEALLMRYALLKGTTSDVSPIHWQHGAIARLEKGETIDKLLVDGYATISLGYVGLYECVKALTGNSHTKEKDLSLQIMNHLRATTEKWKKETGLGFGLYGTPAESLVYRFCRIDKSRFGIIPGITDKDYYTNSYHVFVGEEIDAFDKLGFEAEYQPISSGGCISYIEIPNMSKNVEAVEQVINFMYHNIQYAEFNTKSDNCHICGFDGEILIDENCEWYCPNCGNKDKNKMNVVRRTCGYLGENYWNKGKTQEMSQRVCHL